MWPVRYYIIRCSLGLVTKRVAWLLALSEALCSVLLALEVSDEQCRKPELIESLYVIVLKGCNLLVKIWNKSYINKLSFWVSFNFLGQTLR